MHDVEDLEHPPGRGVPPPARELACSYFAIVAQRRGGQPIMIASSGITTTSSHGVSIRRRAGSGTGVFHGQDLHFGCLLARWDALEECRTYFSSGGVTRRRHSPLDREVPVAVERIQRRVDQLLPPITLADLLNDVGLWTDCFRHLTHLFQRRAPDWRAQAESAGGDLGLGRNHGLGKMASSTSFRKPRHGPLYAYWH